MPCRTSEERKKIIITKHAMQRLNERVKSRAGYQSWAHFVSTARYNGRTDLTMTSEEYEWYLKNIRNLFRSSQVRVWNGFAFIFMGNKGHARTLVTVIAMT